jgi:hypothetical protein
VTSTRNVCLVAHDGYVSSEEDGARQVGVLCKVEIGREGWWRLVTILRWRFASRRL